jgi:hypothetical protein
MCCIKATASATPVITRRYADVTRRAARSCRDRRRTNVSTAFYALQTMQHESERELSTAFATAHGQGSHRSTSPGHICTRKVRGKICCAKP